MSVFALYRMRPFLHLCSQILKAAYQCLKIIYSLSDPHQMYFLFLKKILWHLETCGQFIANIVKQSYC